MGFEHDQSWSMSAWKAIWASFRRYASFVLQVRYFSTPDGASLFSQSWGNPGSMLLRRSVCACPEPNDAYRHSHATHMPHTLTRCVARTALASFDSTAGA